MATELQDGNNVIEKKKRNRKRNKKKEKWEIDEQKLTEMETHRFLLNIKEDQVLDAAYDTYNIPFNTKFKNSDFSKKEKWLIDENIENLKFLPRPYKKPEYRSKEIMKTSRMMLSEWMLHVPKDLTENWIMVPCPIGKRIRLFSCNGITRATDKTDHQLDLFPSALPGGNCIINDNLWYEYAIVDCIWVKSRKIYYLLDVLYWRSMPFTLCEAEFRRYWVNSQLNEMKEFQERDTKTNKFPILPLPNIPCDSDISSALASLDTDLFPLDGLLFYDRHERYTYGCNPLVTWLKPFMLSEVLGISVPPEFEKKPNDYIDIGYYIHDYKEIVRKKKEEQAYTKLKKICNL